MSQTRDRPAYQRGIKAARLWKHLKGTILRWDQHCVSNARKHKLPGWIGHIPMGMQAVIMLTALVFGGMVIASSAVFIVGLLLLISKSSSSEGNGIDSFEYYNDNSEPSYTFKNEEDYFTHCAKHGQFDGPYTPPGEKN
ncbi:TPA: hypothetical protein ACKP2J_001076 [Serratia marcescens]